MGELEMVVKAIEAFLIDTDGEGFTQFFRSLESAQIYAGRHKMELWDFEENYIFEYLITEVV
jgi:hypothetical protein